MKTLHCFVKDNKHMPSTQEAFDYCSRCEMMAEDQTLEGI